MKNVTAFLKNGTAFTGRISRRDNIHVSFFVACSTAHASACQALHAVFNHCLSPSSHMVEYIPQPCRMFRCWVGLGLAGQGGGA